MDLKNSHLVILMAVLFSLFSCSKETRRVVSKIYTTPNELCINRITLKDGRDITIPKTFFEKNYIVEGWIIPDTLFTCDSLIEVVRAAGKVRTVAKFAGTTFTVQGTPQFNYDCVIDSVYCGCFCYSVRLVSDEILKQDTVIFFTPQFGGMDEFVGLKQPFFPELEKTTTVKKTSPTKKTKPSKALIFWKKQAEFWRKKAEKVEEKEKNRNGNKGGKVIPQMKSLPLLPC